MEQRRRGPTLEPVLESATDVMKLATQPSVRYKPHKYGSEEIQKEGRDVEAKAWHCVIMCVKQPLRYFRKLRDRYVKAMNEMAMGGDLTGLGGYLGAGAGGVAHECSYTMERYRNAKDRREEEALRQEELAAMISWMGSKSFQAHGRMISHAQPGS